MKKIREFLKNETIRNFLTIYQQLRNSFIINFSSFVPCVLID